MSTKPSGRPGNGLLAIAIAGSALVVAAGGTAVAVTSTTTIVDGRGGVHKATVDSTGRLSVSTPAGKLSTIDIATSAFTNSNRNADVFSSPTTAQLAVTGFDATSSTTTQAPYQVYLFQVPVNPDGTCSLTSAVRPLAYSEVSPGAPASVRFPNPVQVKPVDDAAYCLDLYVRPLSGATPPTGDLLNVSMNAFVVSGNYSGAGAAVASPADGVAAPPPGTVTTPIPKDQAVGKP